MRAARDASSGSSPASSPAWITVSARSRNPGGRRGEEIEECRPLVSGGVGVAQRPGYRGAVAAPCGEVREEGEGDRAARAVERQPGDVGGVALRPRLRLVGSQPVLVEPKPRDVP